MITPKEKLKAYLSKNNMTQKQLADLAGLYPQVICDIMAGRKVAGVRVGKRIIEATKGEITFQDLRPDLTELRDHAAASPGETFCAKA